MVRGSGGQSQRVQELDLEPLSTRKPSGKGKRPEAGRATEEF
jgi:hypothetical protein